SWATRAPLGSPRGALAVVALGGRLHAIGGSNGQVTGAHEVYDPETDRWTEAPAMPTARDHLAAVAFQGRLWALGGRESFLGKQYATVEVYDPATNGWYTGTPLARALVLVLLLVAPAARWARAAEPTREEALQALAGAADAEARQRAVRWLAEKGAMEDIPALVQALRDVDSRVRAFAENAMWQ